MARVMVIDRNKVRALLPHIAGNVLFFGPPGTGKTSIVEWLAHESGQPVLWVTNCTPDMSAGLLVGHPHLVPIPDSDGKPQFWAKGPGLQALERGEIYLVDDLHKISSDAEAELLTLGNDPRMLKKVLSDGTVIRPANGYRLMATMNGIPQDIDDALRDRFETVFLIDRPSDEMLDKLDSDVREVCIAAYEACDALAGQLPEFSYRECRSFCRRRKEVIASGIVSTTEEADAIAAELALDGNPARANGFLRVVRLAQAADPDAE